MTVYTRTNQIPTPEQHEAMRRAQLTAYSYDRVVAVITEANEVNAQYAALIDELYAPFDGWKMIERVTAPRHIEIAAITKDADQVDARGATRHSREAYPLTRIQTDIRRLRRTIAKLQQLAQPTD